MIQSAAALAILFLCSPIAISANTAAAFLFAAESATAIHRTRTTTTTPTSMPKSSSSLNVLWDPLNNKDHQLASNNMINNEIEGKGEPLVDFPTPSQRTALKKEASKRQARKKLASFSLPEADQLGGYSDETLNVIWELLQQHELLRIKGLASVTKERRLVHSLAEELCIRLELEQERQINDDVTLPVAMISFKGHSSIIYSPTLPMDHPKKFILRTSVGQKNIWKARIKAPRDNRGQIIREPRE